MLKPSSPLFFCVPLNILNVLDAITTLYGLSVGLTELNPLLTYQTIPIKLLLPIILTVTVYITNHICSKHDLTFGSMALTVILLALNVLYTVIVINNVTLILMRD